MVRPSPASTLWPAGVALLGEEAAEGVLHRWVAQERAALAFARTRWMGTFDRALGVAQARTSQDVRGAAGVVQAMVQVDGGAASFPERVRRQVTRLVEAADAIDRATTEAWESWGATANLPDLSTVQVCVDGNTSYQDVEPWTGEVWPTVATCALPWSVARFRVTLVHADLDAARGALASLPRAVNPRHGVWAAWAACRAMPGLQIVGRFVQDASIPDMVWAWASVAAEAAGEACVGLDAGDVVRCVGAVADVHGGGANPGHDWWEARPPRVRGTLRLERYGNVRR